MSEVRSANDRDLLVGALDCDPDRSSGTPSTVFAFSTGLDRETGRLGHEIKWLLVRIRLD